MAAWAAGRDDVRYVGLYDRARCREAVAGAVAVVAPSTWKEAFGLVVVEAMAAGVPASSPPGTARSPSWSRTG